MKRPYFFSVIAALLVNAVSSVFGADVEANIVKGTGYIDLGGNVTAPLPVQSSVAGPRFVWSPPLNTLFFGQAEPTQIFSNNSVSLLGQTSFDGLAILGNSGSGGIALGPASISGNSIAIGSQSGAYGSASIGIGSGYGDNNNYGAIAMAWGSIAIGTWSSSASGFGLAIGSHANSSGDFSTSLGNYVSSIGYGSTSLGFYATSIGDASVALGLFSEAISNESFSIGANTQTRAFGSLALGRFNRGNKRKDGTTEVVPSVSHLSDPALTLGNGTGTSASLRKNAFTVYRDGDAHFAGSVRMKPAGDISMGSFTAGPSRVP